MDPVTISAIMAAIGAIGGGVGRATSSNPYKSYDQQTSAFNKPTIQSGINMGGKLTDAYGNMINNPWKVTSDIGSHFQEDPGYQYAYNEAMRGGRNAFANNGLSGTPEEAKYLAEQAHGMADQGYNNYMNRNLGVMTGGLQGGESTMGRAATANQQTGEAAFGIKDWRNQQNQNMWKSIFGGASRAMPWMFGEKK